MIQLRFVNTVEALINTLTILLHTGDKTN